MGVGRASDGPYGGLPGRTDAEALDEGERAADAPPRSFVLSSDAVRDRVKEAVEDIDFELNTTNLPKEEEDKLREAFAV